MKRLVAALGLALALTASPAAAVTSVNLTFPEVGGYFQTSAGAGQLDDDVDSGLFTDTTHWLEIRYSKVEIEKVAFNYVFPIRTLGLTQDAVFELLLNGVVIDDFTVAATGVDGASTVSGSGLIDPATPWPPTGYDGQILRIQLKQDIAPGSGGVAFAAGGTIQFPLSVAPEPGTWGLMIVGLGLTGAAMRRRRLAVAR